MTSHVSRTAKLPTKSKRFSPKDFAVHYTTPFSFSQVDDIKWTPNLSFLWDFFFTRVFLKKLPPSRENRNEHMPIPCSV
jgi:hypothetical protein